MGNRGPNRNYPPGLGPSDLNIPYSMGWGDRLIGDVPSVIGGIVDRTLHAQGKPRERVKRVLANLKRNVTNLRGQKNLRGVNRNLNLGSRFARGEWPEDSIIGKLPSAIGIFSGPTKTVLGQESLAVQGHGYDAKVYSRSLSVHNPDG